MTIFTSSCNYLLDQISKSNGLVSLSHLGLFVFIYRNQKEIFTYSELSDKTALSIKTLHTYIKVLEGLNIIKRKTSREGVSFDIITTGNYPSKSYYSNLPIFSYIINSNTKNSNTNDLNKEKLKVHEKIIEDLNSVSGRNFKLTATDTIKKISWLLSHEYTFEDFKKVHRNKLDWLDSPKMAAYYRPKTLYAQENFESYLNERKVVDKSKATSSKWESSDKKEKVMKKREKLANRWGME